MMGETLKECCGLEVCRESVLCDGRYVERVLCDGRFVESIVSWEVCVESVM